jgi:DNA polymerase-3 subunit alpha
VDGEAIRFGLVAVKNVGEGAIEAIVAERQNGGFTSLADFCERVDLHRVNRRVIESLIKCGAFDSLGARRSQMMAALDEILEYGQRVQRERNDPQMGLFDTGPAPQTINVPPLPALEEWQEKQLLAFEKESLGFYVTGHPLKRHEEILAKFATVDSITVKEQADGQAVRIGGMVGPLKIIRTRRGDLMAFVSLEDMHGSVESVVFSTVYASASGLLVEDAAILIEGQVQKDEQAVKVLANRIAALAQAEETWTASVHLRLETDGSDRNTLEQLHAILRRHPGECKAYLHLRNAERTETVIALPEQLRVKAGTDLFREVNALLGYSAVETSCAPAKPAERSNGFNGIRRNGGRART